MSEVGYDEDWDNEWTDSRTWKEFRETGLLWFINQILHVFGWAIAIEVDEETGEVIEEKSGFPVRSRFRGFPEESQTRGYQSINHYLKENANQIYEEAEYEEENY